VPIAADWTDPAHYDALAGISAAGLAWEWLRRDPGYRAAWRASTGVRDRGIRAACGGEIADWGLIAFEDPSHTARTARPLWARSSDPSVLTVEARPVEQERDGLDLGCWRGIARLLSCACGAEHLLLHDGDHAVRIDVVAGSIGNGPVCLHYRLHGIASAQPQLLALERLLSLARFGAFAPALFAPPRRLARRLLELRVHDALAAGADHQAIARCLFGTCIASARWRVESSSYRYRVQRLAGAARVMASGGWRTLLAT
jgi:hypothetical protein